ncbi:Hypothetical_protein [Hexamita inflata]|uniref:Hypothetical_protein n=1 Tax=Hexamita inflata TaxID=28002 RepID=A0ABP1HBN7_9EUKA
MVNIRNYDIIQHVIQQQDLSIQSVDYCNTNSLKITSNLIILHVSTRESKLNRSQFSRLMYDNLLQTTSISLSGQFKLQQNHFEILISESCNNSQITCELILFDILQNSFSPVLGQQEVFW